MASRPIRNARNVPQKPDKIAPTFSKAEKNESGAVGVIGAILSRTPTLSRAGRNECFPLGRSRPRPASARAFCSAPRLHSCLHAVPHRPPRMPPCLATSRVAPLAREEHSRVRDLPSARWRRPRVAMADGCLRRGSDTGCLVGVPLMDFRHRDHQPNAAASHAAATTSRLPLGSSAPWPRSCGCLGSA